MPCWRNAARCCDVPLESSCSSRCRSPTVSSPSVSSSRMRIRTGWPRTLNICALMTYTGSARTCTGSGGGCLLEVMGRAGRACAGESSSLKNGRWHAYYRQICADSQDREPSDDHEGTSTAGASAMTDLVLDDRPTVAVRPQDIDTAGAPIHLSNERWRRLLQFMLLNQDDLAILATVPDIGKLAEEVAQSFYDHILGEA